MGFKGRKPLQAHRNHRRQGSRNNAKINATPARNCGSLRCLPSSFGFQCHVGRRDSVKIIIKIPGHKKGTSHRRKEGQQLRQDRCIGWAPEALA